MTTALLETDKKVQEIQKVNSEMITEAKRLASSIKDEDSLKAAIDYGKNIDRMLDQVIAYWKPLVDDAHRHHKDLVKRRDELKTPLEDAKKFILGRPIAAYIDARNRRLAEEQRKRDEQLRKGAEDRKLKEAELLEKKGQPEAASKVLEEPVFIPKAPQEKPKDEVSIRGNWTFEIEDPALIPSDFLMPDEKKIRQHVKTWKDKHGIPGIRAWEEKSTSF